MNPGPGQNRSRRGAAAACAAVLALLGGSGGGQAWGKPLKLPGLEVKQKRIDPESAEAKPNAFTTVVDLEDAATEAANLPDVLADTVGVQVRSLGGLSGFSAVLIRGSSANQVAVFLDGIPLVRASMGTVDLSTLPFFFLDRVEVFRGFLPAEFGSGGIGGGVNLVTRVPGRTSLDEVFASAGSWWTRRAGAFRAQRIGRLGYALSAVYQGSQGDFKYFDDNQTPFQAADDRFRKRANNAFDQVDVLARMRYRPRPRSDFTLLESLTWKQMGLSGTASQPPVDGPFYSFVRQAAHLKFERRRIHGAPLSVMGRAHMLFFREHFSNPEGELINVGRTDAVQHTYTAGVLFRLKGAWGRYQTISMIPDFDFELYRFRDRAGDDGWSPSSLRYHWGLSLRDEVSAWKDRFYLTAVLRVEQLLSRLKDVNGSPEGGGQDMTFFSPRAGVRVRTWRGLAVKANVGRYLRPPSFMELFGLHGTMRGNLDLEPETGINADIGPEYKLDHRSFWLNGLVTEVAFFYRRAKNLIFLMPTANSLVARNWGEADVLGCEFKAAAQFFRQLRITANYTFMKSIYLGPFEPLEGNELPGRPAHEVYARVDWAATFGRWGLGAFTHLSHHVRFYRDMGNQIPSEQRFFLGAGLKFRPWVKGLELTFEARNLIGALVEHPRAPAFTGMRTYPQAVQDYGGYPIPGRAFFVTVNWKND